MEGGRRCDRGRPITSEAESRVTEFPPFEPRIEPTAVLKDMNELTRVPTYLRIARDSQPQFEL